MHGTSGESTQAARAGGRLRGRRSRPAVIATVVALLAAIGVAGCAGHAPASAPGGAASSPAASGAAHPSAAAAVPLDWSAARARAKQTVSIAQLTRLERGRLRNRHAGEANGHTAKPAT
jgi:hypothetical protein